MVYLGTPERANKPLLNVVLEQVLQPLGDPGGLEADPGADRLRVDGVEDLVADDGEAGADDLGALLLQHRDHLVQLERPPGLADEHHVQRPVLIPHLDHRHTHADGRAIAAAAALPTLQLLDPPLELLDVRRCVFQVVQLRHRVLQ
ncbi:hypothetical protein EJB05_31953, partial [Eragrostis curvula]